MVSNMELEYHYTVADEPELDELLSGQRVAEGLRWTKWSKPSRPKPGSTGVVWMGADRPDGPARPLVLIAHEDDIRRLCGRYAQLHSDLSPLTAWCHLLTPRFFEPLDTLVRIPDLGGMEAAWTGLVVAEAVLILERAVASVRISACFATQGYAIARTNALWKHIPAAEISAHFHAANRLCRSETGSQRGESRTGKIRSCLEPIWDVLIGVSQGRNVPRARELEPLAAALLALKRARADKDKQEARQLIRPLLAYVPEAETFEQLTDLAPEMRLKLYDKLVVFLNDAQAEHGVLRHNALALLAGYLATVAAGGAPSLSLAEGNAPRWPEITAWAYLVGGIGENVVWTSGFDGLGRLVARELLRPLRLDEPPTCDFAFDEANVVADSRLPDPLVHLRVKQARLVTVALFPGVNISIPIADTAVSGASKVDTSRPTRSPESYAAPRDPIASFADALWPHFRLRLDDYLKSFRSAEYAGQEAEDSQRNRGKRRSGSQSQLPLGNPGKHDR